MIDAIKLRAAANDLGFDVIGVAPLKDAGAGWLAPHAKRLRAWLDAGMAADMDWLGARLEARVVPSTLMPDAQAAIALWVPNRCPPLPRPADQVGRVSAYAWGRDYHNVVRKMVRKLRRWVCAEYPGAQIYISIDTGAVLERAVAERASVGWIGKSTMLIHPKHGTHGTLAALFVDRQVSELAPKKHPFRCGTCTACIDDCPTGAIGPMGVDARLCISYWTIEHRGLIPVEIRAGIGDWVFGCDICQDVCPWNGRATFADPAIWKPQQAHAHPDLLGWLRLSNSALDAALQGSPLRRARPEGLKRNAMIVLANTGTKRAVGLLESCLEGDPDPVLRATAAWAARCLGSTRASALAAADPDPMVRAESTSRLPPASACGTP